MRSTRGRMLGAEHGGMNEVLANLYGVTGNTNYLQLAEAFNHQKLFGPLSRGAAPLDRLGRVAEVVEQDLLGERERTSESGAAGGHALGERAVHAFDEFDGRSCGDGHGSSPCIGGVCRQA